MTIGIVSNPSGFDRNPVGELTAFFIPLIGQWLFVTFEKRTNIMEGHFPILSSSRLLLRQFTPDDTEKVFEGLSHPEVIKYYGVHFDSLEATKEQMTWFADLEKNGTGIWWAICRKGDGQFIGAGGLNNLEKDHQKAEIGFWLLPDYWGQGYMQEAMPLILDYAFNALKLHRIEGFVESNNENCKRAMAKLHFVHEGTMQDCEMKDGHFVSLGIFAKLNTP